MSYFFYQTGRAHFLGACQNPNESWQKYDTPPHELQIETHKDYTQIFLPSPFNNELYL